MMYTVKEIYFTLQGEGSQTGRAAVFLRFAGCNPWTGRERDRPAASCRFCDTDFVGTDGPGGGKFATTAQLAAAVADAWLGDREGAVPYVVCTGGEPLLQPDRQLADALHDRGFEAGIETNGTIAAPPDIDWICVSPKGDVPLVQDRGDELKLVYPQAERAGQPDRFEKLDFEHWFLQPLDDANRDEHTRATIRYCLDHPRWRLSVQTHNGLGIP